MFIISLTYQKSLGEVERALPEHIAYLESNYAENRFLCSGRKNPRTGGIILCRAESAAEAETIVREDPFYRQGIARYEITEFFPTKFAPGFEKFL